MTDEKYTLKMVWSDYKSELVFGLVLSVLLVISSWLSHLLPVSMFDKFINPALCIACAVICFFGAGLCLRHHDGIRVRRSWAVMLIGWGMWEMLAVVLAATATPEILQVGTDTMSSVTMIIACVFAWLLFIYPTELLRPGWMNWKNALLQLLPLAVLGALDYVIPYDLRWLIALYPIGLFTILIRHIRKYRVWCEDNFSTLDDIDVQWIVRYVMMVMLAGSVFYWLCISHQPARAFTQQWFLMFVLAYTTERVLFRPDPWKQLRSMTEEKEEEVANPINAAYRATLENWLEKEKPYLNTDFQLMDLHRVLPLNRTYLSQLINTEYGCSFYQWVNGLRIDEAKRLKTEHPDWTAQDIAERCGFSSARVFYRTLSRETGMTSKEWWRFIKDGVRYNAQGQIVK